MNIFETSYMANKQLSEKLNASNKKRVIKEANDDSDSKVKYTLGHKLSDEVFEGEAAEKVFAKKLKVPVDSLVVAKISTADGTIDDDDFEEFNEYLGEYTEDEISVNDDFDINTLATICKIAGVKFIDVGDYDQFGKTVYDRYLIFKNKSDVEKVIREINNALPNEDDEDEKDEEPKKELIKQKKVIYTGGELRDTYDVKEVEEVIIKDGVKKINGHAFDGCKGLKDITIPDSVTSIGTFAFWGCKGLTSITIPDSVTSIGYGAFEDCAGLTSITIPDSVTSIGNYAFWDCKGLTSITISDSIISIGDRAFAGCKGLKKVNYTGDIADWCKISFYNDGSNPLYNAHNLYINSGLVTDLTIPNSVKSIGNYAFFGCTSLTSITISNNVTSIGEEAFGSCTGLKNITIPDSVIEIGRYAFWDCDNLTIKCNKGSYAESYAIENDIPVEYIQNKLESKKITNERFKRDYAERTKYLLADMNDEKKFADDLIEFMGGIDALDFEIEDGHLVAKIPVADSVFSIDFNTDDATALTNMEYPDYMDLFIDISVQDFGDPIDTYDALHDTFDLSDYGINEDDEDDEDDDFDEDDESYI